MNGSCSSVSTVSATTFVAAACANIDNDATLDTWTMTETNALLIVTDDVSL